MLVSWSRTPDRILRSMRLEGQIPLEIANEDKSGDGRVLQYELHFYRALLTFRYHVVFDPQLRKVSDYLIKCLESDLASAIRCI